MNREPLITVATIVAFVTAAIALLVAFGLDLTGDQQTALLALVTWRRRWSSGSPLDPR